MKSFSHSDEQRVASLHALELLDTGQQPSFDRVTKHCSQIFACSISMISLVDTKRLWVLSSVGLHKREIPRKNTITNQIVVANCTLLVTRASTDDRFADTSLVKAKPGLVD